MEKYVNYRGNVVEITKFGFNERGRLYFVGKAMIEEFPAVYQGRVQYLSHEERVRIIQRPGDDYDVVPADWQGPKVKMREMFQVIFPFELGLAVLEEWDGAVNVVSYKRVEARVVAIMYEDGVTHEIPLDDFERMEVKKAPVPRPDMGYW